MWSLAEHCRRPVLERPVHSRACNDSRVSGEVGRAVEARAAKPPLPDGVEGKWVGQGCPKGQG